MAMRLFEAQIPYIVSNLVRKTYKAQTLELQQVRSRNPYEFVFVLSRCSLIDASANRP